jgi:hypothetical protein
LNSIADDKFVSGNADELEDLLNVLRKQMTVQERNFCNSISPIVFGALNQRPTDGYDAECFVFDLIARGLICARRSAVLEAQKQAAAKQKKSLAGGGF